MISQHHSSFQFALILTQCSLPTAQIWFYTTDSYIDPRRSKQIETSRSRPVSYWQKVARNTWPIDIPDYIIFVRFAHKTILLILLTELSCITDTGQ